MFAGSLVVMGGFLYFIYQTNGNQAPTTPTLAGGAVIQTSIGKVEKSRPDEQTQVPETSPIFKEIQKSEDKKVEAAETGTSSYIAGIQFRNEQRAANMPSEQSGESAPATGIDDILNKRKQEQHNNKQQVAQGQQGQQVRAAPLFDEDMFLKEEIQNAQQIKEKMSAQVGEMKIKGSGFVAQTHYASDTKSTMADESGSSYLSMASNGTGKGSSAKKGGRDLSSQIEDKKTGSVDTKTLNRGKRYYGILNIGINTDEPSPTTATVIEGGDLMGAEFIAETPVRAGEKAVITFNSMAVNGKDYQVRAIALDPESQRSGLADSVNRHIMERYLKLGIAAFVDGYADSLQDSTTTMNDSGNTTTKTNAVTDSATQMKIAVGKVGEAFVPAFEDEFKRPPTIEVNSNREVVIMLLDPLELDKQK